MHVRANSVAYAIAIALVAVASFGFMYYIFDPAVVELMEVAESQEDSATGSVGRSHFMTGWSYLPVIALVGISVAGIATAVVASRV